MPALDQIEFEDLYPLKVIKNKTDYQKALKSMEAVFDEKKGPLAEYAETLAILIEHYEEELYPIITPAICEGQRTETVSKQEVLDILEGQA